MIEPYDIFKGLPDSYNWIKDYKDFIFYHDGYRIYYIIQLNEGKEAVAYTTIRYKYYASND